MSTGSSSSSGTTTKSSKNNSGGSGKNKQRPNAAADGATEESPPEPNRYHKFLVNRPCWMVGAVMGIQCLCFGVFLLTVALGAMTVELEVILEDRDNSYWQEAAALREARAESSSTSVSGAIPAGSQAPQGYTRFLYLIYEARDMEGVAPGQLGPLEEQVFTEQNIKDIRELEQKILELPGWTKYCFTGSTGAPDPDATRTRADCRPGFLSVSQYFYPLYNGTSDDVLVYFGNDESTRMADVDTVLDLMQPRPPVSPEFIPVPQFVDPNFKTSGKSEITRSLFLFGLPLEGEDYDDDQDIEQQRLEIRQWADENLWDLVHDQSTDTMRILHFGILSDREYEERIIGDMLLVLGSAFIIFSLIWFVSRSLFIAGMSMLQIATTFPTSLVILVFIFQQTYVGILHLLAIFIILGIGADDVFVFVDAWRQSAIQLPGESLEVRMAWSFDRAAGAMLVTSATTFAAFVITAISPFVSLSGFGSFAALLVLVNYLMVISLLPAVIVIQHKIWGPGACLPCMKDPDPEKPSFLELFFTQKMGPFVRRFRAPLVVFFGALMLASIGVATLTQPKADVFKLLPNGFNYQDALERLQDFEAGDGNLVHEISMVFGIDGIDYSEEAGADRLDTDKPGTVLFYDDFDLTQAATQQRLSEACAEPARAFSAGDTDLEVDLTKEPTCFIDSFYDWKAAQNASIAPFSITGAEFTAELDLFFRSLIGSEFSSSAGKVDGEYKWCVLTFATTLPLETTFVSGGPARLAWTDMMDEFNEGSPASLGDGYAYDRQWQWHWVAQLLVSQIFISVGVSLVLAYIVLTLFLMNPLVAMIAMLSLIAIVASFFAFLVIAGWTIGFEESILGIMVVGLAVDFTSHFAHSYAECPKPTREERTQWAFEKLGVSVLSGGVTTALATSLLLAASLIYLTKYGAMLAVTVFLSWTYANLFFMPMVCLFGPQGRTGDMRPAATRLWARLSRKCRSLW